MVRTLSIVLVAISALFMATPRALAGDTFRAEARLAQGAVRAKADYREFVKNGQPARRLKIEVQNATPGATYPVVFGGQQIGVITVGPLGRGVFDRQTITDDPGKQGDVPVVHAGDTIGVGAMAGAFRAR